MNTPVLHSLPSCSHRGPRPRVVARVAVVSAVGSRVALRGFNTRFRLMSRFIYTKSRGPTEQSLTVFDASSCSQTGGVSAGKTSTSIVVGGKTLVVTWRRDQHHDEWKQPGLLRGPDSRLLMASPSVGAYVAPDWSTPLMFPTLAKGRTAGFAGSLPPPAEPGPPPAAGPLPPPRYRPPPPPRP